MHRVDKNGGTTVDQATMKGFSDLMNAREFGHVLCALIEAKADVEAQQNQGQRVKFLKGGMESHKIPASVVTHLSFTALVVLTLALPMAPATMAQAYLNAPHAWVDDAFGCAVAMPGDTTVVGANAVSSCATHIANGVSGYPTDNGCPVFSAAYVDVRNGSTWTAQAYLTAPDAWVDGFAVAMPGDTTHVQCWTAMRMAGVIFRAEEQVCLHPTIWDGEATRGSRLRRYA